MAYYLILLNYMCFNMVVGSIRMLSINYVVLRHLLKSFVELFVLYFSFSICSNLILLLDHISEGNIDQCHSAPYNAPLATHSIQNRFQTFTNDFTSCTCSCLHYGFTPSREPSRRFHFLTQDPPNCSLFVLVLLLF